MSEDPNVVWRSTLSRPLEREVFQPLSAIATVEVAAASICGFVRPHNTDHYLAIRLTRAQDTLLSSLAESDLPQPFTEYGYAFAVADGLGERDVGARASRVVLSTLAHLTIRLGKWNVRVTPAIAREITDLGEYFYRRAHEALREARRSDPALADMSASITAVYIAGGDLFFAHVGHAKAFLYREGSLVQLTTDHTVDRERVDARGPVAVSRQTQDFTHEISNVIGGHAEPRIDIEHFEVFTGDRLLLCTNGLTDVLSEQEIAGVLALQRRPADDCQRFIELAQAAHAPDDVTAMVADYRLRR